MQHYHPSGLRWRAVLAALAAVVVGSAVALAAPIATPAWACVPPACATPPPPDDPPIPLPPIRMVIMGDSYTSGEGMGMGNYQIFPGTSELDWRHQSAYAPAMLAWMYLEVGRKPALGGYNVLSGNLQTNWGTDHVDFAASSGATTDNITQPQIDSDTGLQRSAPQGNALDSSTNVAYFGFGGNDAHFADLFSTAVKYYLVGSTIQAANRIPGSSWQQIQTDAVATKVNELLAGMPQVSTKVENGLTATWQKAPNAQIIVALYPQGLKPSGNPDIPFVAGTSLDKMYAFGEAVNTAIRAAVANFQRDHPSAPQIHIFDPNTAGPNGSSVVAGHELGQPGSYFNKLIPNTLELKARHTLHGVQESFHPNQLGGVAIGTALATWLHEDLPGLWPNPPDFQNVHTNPVSYADNPQGDADFAAWAALNLPQFCVGVTDPDLCSLPPSDGGNGGYFPGDGGVFNPNDPNADLLEFLLRVYTVQTGAGSSSGSSSGTASGTTTGDAIDEYANMEGHWVHLWTDENGKLHQDPMPDGFQPPPDKVIGPTPTDTDGPDAGDDPADGADPDDGDDYGDDPGEDYGDDPGDGYDDGGGYDDPGDGYDDGGDNDGGYDDPGNGYDDGSDNGGGGSSGSSGGGGSGGGGSGGSGSGGSGGGTADDGDNGDGCGDQGSSFQPGTGHTRTLQLVGYTGGMRPIDDPCVGEEPQGT